MAMNTCKHMAMAAKHTVICYGCGKDITEQPTNRYNLLGPSCSKSLPVWKRLVSECLSEMNIDLYVNELLQGGKMCRPCTSALQRLDKLERSTRESINEAIECLLTQKEISHVKAHKNKIR